MKRSLRVGVRHLLGVPEEESLQEFVEQRSAHLRRRGERALRSLERVLQGLGIAPPPRAGTPETSPEAPHVERPEPTKFDLGQRHASTAPQEHIPWGYGQDRVTAMPVDPDHLYTYWEVTDDSIAAARRDLGAAGEGAWLSLRVYDVTGRIFDGTNAHAYFDHRVERHDRQWFFTIGKPGSTVCVEIGLKSSEGYFVRIARSARVDCPRSAPVSAGEVEWMSVRSATGEIESSHTMPAPESGAARSAAGPDAAPAGAPELERAAAEAPPHEVARHAADGARHATDGARVASWRDVLPGAWHEVRRTQQWVGDVEHTSWEAGPFAHPVEVPRLEVEERYGGGGTVEQSGLVTRILEGPWEVVIRGIGGHVQRRVLARWEIVRTAAPESEANGVAVLDGEDVTLGGSERVARRGASDRRFAGSEVRLAGASEEFMVGASELRYRGASERLYAGASERRWAGASERVAAGAAQWAFAGASERSHAGASEYRLGGASEIVHSARESWQAFADQGARIAGVAPAASAPLPPLGGASERRLAGSVPDASAPADASAPRDAADPPLPPRW